MMANHGMWFGISITRGKSKPLFHTRSGTAPCGQVALFLKAESAICDRGYYIIGECKHFPHLRKRYKFC